MAARIRTTLAYVLSWSIALGPITAGAEGDGTRGEEISTALSGLLERAAYPKIPRLGASGMPTSSDLDSQERAVRDLRQSIQSTLLEKITAVDDTGGGNEADEKRILLALDEVATPLENYFEAASKIESLKILTGMPVDENSWEKKYTLRLPADPISQKRFLEAIGLHSDYAVFLPVPGYDKDKVDAQLKVNFHYVSALELNAKNEWELVFRLNPEFANRTERFKFMMRPELKSTLQFTAHFSADTLYTSLGLTRALLGQEPDSLPAVPAGASRYLSLRLARQARVNDLKREMYAIQKPLIFKAVVDTVEQMGKHGSVSYVLDDAFWAEFARISGRVITPSTPEEITAMRAAEFEAFTRAEAAILNLVDLKHTYKTREFFLERAKLLSLRSLMITSQKAPLTGNALASLENLLDARAKRWADEMANSTQIVAKVQKIKEMTAANLLRNKRVEFQKKLEIAAASLRDFEKQEINVAYLYASKKGQIEALQPGPLVKALTSELEQQTSYEKAYTTLMEALNTYVGVFNFKGEKAVPASLAVLGKIAPKFTFNPAAVQVPAKFAGSLNPPRPKGYIESAVDALPNWLTKSVNAKKWTPEEPDTRKKDLLDMIEVARLLKFDVYETLADKKATPDTLLFDNKGLGKTLRFERRAYLDQMERDVVTNSPVLGGQTFAVEPTESYAPTTAVWRVLAQPKRSATEKFQVVETQLRAVESQIYADQRALDGEIPKIDALPERASIEDVGTLNGDLKTIMTRAAQIRLGLQSFSSYAAFYDDMVRELDLPTVYERAWGQFSSFANNAALFGIILVAAPKMAARLGLTGVVTSLFGRDMAGLTPLIFGSLGVMIAEPAVRGWYTEAVRTETLRKYFECGSESRCIATFSDVANQTEVMYGARKEFLGMLAVAAFVPFGMRAARMFSAYRMQPGGATLRVLRQDMATLGLNETSSLSENAIGLAMRDTLAKAQALPDNGARVMAQIYARQAYWRLENRLQKESLKWMSKLADYRAELRRFGVGERNWTQDATFEQLLAQADNAYKSGQMLTSDYNGLRSLLLRMQADFAPSWKAMDQNPLMKSLYERVWSRASSSSHIGLVEDFRYSGQQFQNSLLGRMDAFYGRGLRSFQVERSGRIYWTRPDLYPSASRYDQMLEKIAKEVQDAPQLSEQRMREMRRLVGGRP